MSETTALQLLHCGHLRAAVAPHIGGSLASFYSLSDPAGTPRHWLRAASEQALRQGDPFEMASFPLVPWANRIRGGRFPFDGQEVQLPPNRGSDPHTIHGLGWSRAWSVCERSNAHISLRLRYDGDAAWPYAFTATQRYTLDAQGLCITMGVTNDGPTPMPADLGHHPYLPHDRSGAGTRVRAQVQKIWESDDQVLPRALSASHAAVQALQQGMCLRDFDLDNNFTGFGGQAQVHWPDGSSLRMQSDALLNYFVLYCPKAADIFCIEPVSNCTDWLNLRTPEEHARGLGALAHEAGGHVLGPGESLQASMRLDPSPIPTLP